MELDIEICFEIGNMFGIGNSLLRFSTSVEASSKIERVVSKLDGKEVAGDWSDFQN